MTNCAGTGAKIYYSKLYRNEFFVFSYSVGITDAYIRYHQAGQGGVGFSLYWYHAATDAHIERIATLISGSLGPPQPGLLSPIRLRSSLGGQPATPAPIPGAAACPEPRTAAGGSSLA